MEALLAQGRPRRTPTCWRIQRSRIFSGVKHPLALINAARDPRLARASRRGGVRADQTASTWRAVTPDFVTISFYKMFGYPTGVGCLLIRNATLNRLRRPVVCRRHRELRPPCRGRLHVL